MRPGSSLLTWLLTKVALSRLLTATTHEPGSENTVFSTGAAANIPGAVAHCFDHVTLPYIEASWQGLHYCRRRWIAKVSQPITATSLVDQRRRLESHYTSIDELV